MNGNIGTKWVNPFQPSVAFLIEPNHPICTAFQDGWFLYGMQHWLEMSNRRKISVDKNLDRQEQDHYTPS